jgi:MFS transporter, UMF1 family
MFYGATNVLSNAYLPVLVRNHPDLHLEPVVESSSASSSASVTESTPLITSQATLAEEAEKANRLAAHISSRGLTYGYIAALILQVSAVGSIYFLGVDNPIALKFPIFLAATWWAIFFFPTVPFWLKPRPGPPLSGTNIHRGALGELARVVKYIGFGWKQIWETIKEVRRLREVQIYLFSWFLLSDGVITMSALAIIYAKTSLELTPAGLAMISGTALIMNALGAFLWPSVIAVKLNLSVVPTMKLLISLVACLPGYAMVGLIWPGVVDTLGFGALTHAWELYTLAAVFGFLAGGVNVYGRAIFAELIPSGKESTFFSVRNHCHFSLTWVVVCNHRQRLECDWAGIDGVDHFIDREYTFCVYACCCHVYRRNLRPTKIGFDEREIRRRRSWPYRPCNPRGTRAGNRDRWDCHSPRRVTKEGGSRVRIKGMCLTCI